MPVTLKNFPKQLTNGKYADAVFQRFKRLKYTSSLEDSFALEEEMRKTHNAALKKARVLLKRDHRDEAINLLNEAFAENWRKVEEFENKKRK